MRIYKRYSNTYFGRLVTSICRLSRIRHLHFSHNKPYLHPQILHNLCFSFLLGITAVPRENENNTYAKFCGANKEQYGSLCKWRIEGNRFNPWHHMTSLTVMSCDTWSFLDSLREPRFSTISRFVYIPSTCLQQYVHFLLDQKVKISCQPVFIVSA